MRATRFLLAALAVGLGVPTGAQTVVTESDPDACELWACADAVPFAPTPDVVFAGAMPRTPSDDRSQPGDADAACFEPLATLGWPRRRGLHRAQLLPGGPRRARARWRPAVGAPQR